MGVKQRMFVSFIYFTKSALGYTLLFIYLIRLGYCRSAYKIGEYHVYDRHTRNVTIWDW